MNDSLVVKCPKCGNPNRFESEKERQDVINERAGITCVDGTIIKGCGAKFIVVPDGLQFVGYK